MREIFSTGSGGQGRERFAALIEGYRPVLVSVARRMCGSSGIDPEDLVQETLERALLHRERLAPAPEPAQKSWLCTTLSSRFLDHCRRRRTEAVGQPALEVVHPSSVDPERPPREAWEQVSDADFLAAIAQLKPNLRRAYELHVAGHRYRAISAQLGVPEGTVGTWLFHARQELRALLVPTVMSARAGGEP